MLLLALSHASSVRLGSHYAIISVPFHVLLAWRPLVTLPSQTDHISSRHMIYSAPHQIHVRPEYQQMVRDLKVHGSPGSCRLPEINVGKSVSGIRTSGVTGPNRTAGVSFLVRSAQPYVCVNSIIPRPPLKNHYNHANLVSHLDS